MGTEDFEKLVFEALAQLPGEFKKAMDNVDVVIEDWPSLELSRGRLLLGLYQGVPKTTWGRGLGQQIPDKITIFRGPIVFVSRQDEEAIKRIVADTVKHEIAHHFGFSEERIREIEQGK